MREELHLEDILQDRAVEDELMEVPLTARMFKLFLGGAFILFAVVITQVFLIGARRHTLYERSARANMFYTEIEPAPRGVIVDRNGELLVDNRSSVKAFVSMRFLPSNAAERNEALRDISEVTGMPAEEVTKRLKEHDWRLGRLLLVRDVPHDMLVELTARHIPGVEIEPGFARVPAHPFAISHITGYVGLADERAIEEGASAEEEVGKTGLEKQYDALLRGTQGTSVTVLNAREEVQGTRDVEKPREGRRLETFIDKGLQEYVYDRMAEQISFLGARGGVGIVMDAEGGEVRALISVPSFKVDNVQAYLSGAGDPLFNRAVSGLYNPGSTIKPLVAIAALEEGVMTPEHELYSSGQLVVENPYSPGNPSIFGDWKAHGWVNMRAALARSSNVYFYIVGGGFENEKGLGISRLRLWWSTFGLGKKTGIDLPAEAAGFLPSPGWKEKTGGVWRVGDTYNVTIGQGAFTVTPLELINYIAAIADGGVFYKPRIAVESPEALQSVVRLATSTLAVVREGMREAVTSPLGTAHLLNFLPLEAAAKTGSAEVTKSRTNALVVGYAPYDKPEIVFLFMIEDAREGGSNVVPVAHDVLMWYYERYKKS
ncbi:hypothetical protein A2110_01195 [Candidatus Jorgensenbacteria bacterium GWA1_54_12]|uniref:beta-lactamase n=1 Tax=Candidatus Jorgensenbacteria bacterium GWA1_54_12 TaxID=1798468 RepID=A0A1F6BIP2_9BACT|nr:MAG: hypothetical protein A2110_01195 [Candidatus Jorgensenbacteria bacterium GWA1_54_12]